MTHYFEVCMNRAWDAITFPSTLAQAHLHTECKNRWRYAHQAMALMLYIPVIGHVVALFKLIVLHKGRSQAPENSSDASPSLASRTVQPLIGSEVRVEQRAPKSEKEKRCRKKAKQWMLDHPPGDPYSLESAIQERDIKNFIYYYCLHDKSLSPDVTFEDIATVLEFCVQQNVLAFGVRYDSAKEVMFKRFQQGEEVLNPPSWTPQEKGGWTPLMAAALCGNIKVVTSLLKMGVSPKTSNCEGKTAFLIAAGQNHLEVMRLLLQTKSISLQEGELALKEVVSGNHPSSVAFLLERGVKSTLAALKLAIHNKNRDIVERLLDAGGVNPNEIINRDGETLIVYAERVAGKDPEILDLLIQHGADYEKGKNIEQWARYKRAVDRHWRLDPDVTFESMYTHRTYS